MHHPPSEIPDVLALRIPEGADAIDPCLAVDLRLFPQDVIGYRL